MRRSRRSPSIHRNEAGATVWPVLADVVIGFLVLILLVAAFSFQQLAQALEEEEKKAEGTHRPPSARDEFKQSFNEEFRGVLAAEPKIVREEFAELQLRFPETLLFPSCGYRLYPQGREAMDFIRGLLNRYEDSIDRVQVTGHTDKDRPHPIVGPCAESGITSNLQLAAWRAIEVTRLLAPDDRTGLDPAKIWPVALGPHHPVDPTANQNDSRVKQENRRIEVLIKFHESEPAPSKEL